MPATTSELLKVVGELYRQTDLALFPRAVLAAIRQVIPCAFASYNEMSLRNQTVNFVAEPADYEATMRRAEAPYWKWKHQHPLTPFTEPGVASPAHSISEFITPEELRRLEIHEAFFALANVEDSMLISLMTTSCSNIFVMFNREPGEHFTKEDRDLLDLLGPHLVQAFDNAYAFAESRALALLAQGTMEASTHGLLLVNRQLQIVHRNDVGRELMESCFGEQSSLLPEMLRRWLLGLARPATLREPLEAVLEDGRQIVFRACETKEGGWLIAAQESHDSPAQLGSRFGLTPREADVLHWVKRGKSNPEIGTILETSSRTVDKHMERVLRKLGVESRTAAIIMTLEA